jgi:glycosyltransferase involved in cell wall biosynthesis
VGLDAHVVGRRQTGNETYIVGLGSALARRSDVDLLAYVDRDVSWPGPDGPQIKPLSLRSRYVRIPLELPIRARRDRVSLLHVQYVSPPLSPVPIAAAIHDLSFIDVPDGIPSRTVWRLKATVAVTARRAAVFLAISSYTRERLIDHYRIDPDRVVVTPVGVDPRWRPLARQERSERLAAAGLTPLPERFVLAVGVMRPRKNLDRLVRAVAAVRASGDSDVELILAGPRDAGSSAVQETVDRLNAQHWVRFVGYLSDEALVALVGQATVVAHPSRYEGFGLPVLEAMACRAVVVASDRTSIPEVAGDAALLVDPDSDESMAEAILTALTDDGTRTRLAAAGPIRAAMFDWDRCAAATVEAYRVALS